MVCFRGVFRKSPLSDLTVHCCLWLSLTSHFWQYISILFLLQWFHLTPDNSVGQVFSKGSYLYPMVLGANPASTKQISEGAFLPITCSSSMLVAIQNGLGSSTAQKHRRGENVSVPSSKKPNLYEWFFWSPFHLTRIWGKVLPSPTLE